MNKKNLSIYNTLFYKLVIMTTINKSPQWMRGVQIGLGALTILLSVIAMLLPGLTMLSLVTNRRCVFSPKMHKPDSIKLQSRLNIKHAASGNGIFPIFAHSLKYFIFHEF